MSTNQYLSVRGTDGWSTQDITPRQSFPSGELDKGEGAMDWSLFQGFTENLAFGFLVAEEPVLVPGAPAHFYSPYVENMSDGAYTLLSSTTPSVQKPGRADNHVGFMLYFAGMSTDGTHAIFEANDAVLPNATPGKMNLYESVDGHLELVNEVGGGTVAPLGYGGPTETSEQGVRSNYGGALSESGTRAFWTGLNKQIYMHELTPAGPVTVDISASQKTNGPGNGPRPSHYWTATPDGSLVYFTSCQQLTNDSTAEVTPEDQPGECSRTNGVEGLQGNDLYRYDANTGVLSDLTVDPNAGETASVNGVIGASSDGSYVYFDAKGALAPGGKPGGNNLYVWHAGTTSFIGAFKTEDGGGGSGLESHNYDEGLINRTSRVSPDGRYLAFQSNRPLTGYDNIPVNQNACRLGENFSEGEEGRCMEAFEYDAATAKLICVSCNRDGLPPLGPSGTPAVLRAVNPDYGYAGWQSRNIQQRYLLDDGRMFFTSLDALVSQASNGQQNVYEYEPEGDGSCRSAEGCVYLISSGTAVGPSWFADASADGNNVFIVTRQQLAPQDGDEVLDVYDARVDGGFSPPVPAPCSGEACRPPNTPAPTIYQAPPSATFVGPGNPIAPVATVKPSTKNPRKKTKSKKKKSKKKSKDKKASKGKSGRLVGRGGKVGK